MRLIRRGSARARLFVLILGLALAAAAVSVPAGAAQQSRSPAREGFQGETRGFPDLDLRGRPDRPTAARSAAAQRLGAKVRWNAFGTPASLIAADGSLAEGLSADPVAAARSWLRDNRELFGLSSARVDELELLASNRVGSGAVVLLRQRFGGLPAGHDGLVAVAVSQGRVVYASSTLTSDQTLTGSVRVSAEQAVAAAAQNVGRAVSAAQVSRVRQEGDWTLVRVAGFEALQRARLVALPTMDAGVRPAFETLLAAPADSFGFTHFVDAETGEVLIRESLIDYASDNPKWDVFPGAPPLDYSTNDTRVTWCGTAADPGCERVVDDPASPSPGTSTPPPAPRPSRPAATAPGPPRSGARRPPAGPTRA